MATIGAGTAVVQQGQTSGKERGREGTTAAGS